MESNKHHTLVKKIYDYVSNLEIVEKDLIQCDIFEVSGNVTRMPEGFVPDLYYKFNDVLIIGEAKTDEDFDRDHSKMQYGSYYKYLNNFLSQGYKCMFIIAVPWETSIAACSLVKKRSSNNSICSIVINELGVYKEYEKNNFKK